MRRAQFCRTTYIYHPPQDFSELAPSLAPKSNPFSAANLKGKQLWFITAPADAPLPKLASVAAEDVTQGAAVMETKSGRKFSFKVDEDALEEATRVSVLAPDAKGVYREGIL